MTAPLVSVVIPTFNRPAQLERCLHALALQTYPRERFEVVVVDDGSEPPLGVAGAAQTSGLQVRILRTARAGPGAARNAGAHEARGQVLAFLDDDCRPESLWLAELVRRVEHAPDLLVGAQIRNGCPERACSTASHRLVEYIHATSRSDRGPSFLSSMSFAVQRQAFLGRGGFDPEVRHASEDRELCDRWHQSGGRMEAVEQAIVHHAHELGLWSFLRQHFGYGRGAYEFRHVLARRHTGLPRIERPAYYLALVLSPLRGPASERSLQLSCLLALSQAATLAGFAWQWALARTALRLPRSQPGA